MEPRNEFSCIRVNMDDMASLEEVSELYFREREKMSTLMRMTHLGATVVQRVAKMNVTMKNLRCSPIPQKVGKSEEQLP